MWRSTRLSMFGDPRRTFVIAADVHREGEDLQGRQPYAFAHTKPHRGAAAQFPTHRRSAEEAF